MDEPGTGEGEWNRPGRPTTRQFDLMNISFSHSGLAACPPNPARTINLPSQDERLEHLITS
jgi:hypothetical protein